jgi:hypothetical protein
MKKYAKILTFISIAIIMIALPCMHAFAQDSSSVTPVATGAGDLFSFLVSFIPVKYQATALLVVTGLFLLEQFLAASSKFKANSTFQLVAGWITLVYNAIKGKK